MVFNDLRKNENKGFSLVELIVVIAIMAVMVAVLAPSLLSYVEKSRSQKDDSAMGEVVNAIQIAMSEESVFNEVLKYSKYGNYSCYVDATAQKSEEDLKKYKVVTKAANAKASGKHGQAEQWMYDEETRKDDEVPYNPAGSMRGVTLTFTPEKNSNGNFEYTMGHGAINNMTGAPGANVYTSTGTGDETAEYKIDGSKQVARQVAQASTTAGAVAANDAKAKEDSTYDVSKNISLDSMTTSKRGDHYLYNSVKSTVGDKIQLSSKTYRNSEYTVFIRIGSVGGKSAGGDSIKVYGQWNGTNLSTAG